MEIKVKKFATVIILLSACICYADTIDAKIPSYFAFPKAYDLFKYKFLVGAGITKLPTQIVEEEINTVPIIFVDFRIGLPLNFTSNLYLATNYLTTIATVGLQHNLINNDFTFAVGAKGSFWYGQVDIESIRLKTFGYLIKPYGSLGIDFGGVLLSGLFEIQSGYMETFAENLLLAKFYQPMSSYTFKIIVEQPLYHKQWVMLGLGLNYATFYYQSWLSYSSVKQYLLYPEFFFGFIL